MEPHKFAFDVCRRYISDYKSELGERLYNKVEGAIRARDLVTLTSISDLRVEFQDPFILRYLLQIEAFFKKNEDFAVDKVCEEAASRSFHQAEKICRITNRRLDYYYEHQDRLDPDMLKWVRRMENWISRTLGTYSDFLKVLPEMVAVTAGATATRSRRQSLPHLKMRLRQVCTPRAAPYVTALARFWGVRCVKTRLVNWNRVEWVRKSWKTHRTIACEAEGNVPFQLAFDTYGKDKLRSVGIDLRSQLRNQQMAWHGSITGHYATVDIRSASDLEAYNTVAWLFPHEWFAFLDDIRSSHGRLPDGTHVRYAKFSSMGNGTTFVTETLVFAAAAYAVTGSNDFTVYGDDIIVPSSVVEDLKRVLGFFGFAFNIDKTHVTGPFRESCGVNYVYGRDITPFYLRRWERSQEERAHLVNGLVSIGLPEGSLWKFAAQKAHGLPRVPLTESTTQGVWIDTPSCYTAKLLKRKNNQLWYRALLTKQARELIVDSRTLFLWHFGKGSQRRVAIDVLSNEALRVIRQRDHARPKKLDATSHFNSSSVPTYSHKCVRKWVRWYPPAATTPVYLYWWTDYLLAETMAS